MNDRYQKDCLRKKRYSTRTRALEVIADIRKRRPETPELFDYKCPHCHGYHLTRSPRRALPEPDLTPWQPGEFYSSFKRRTLRGRRR